MNVGEDRILAYVDGRLPPVEIAEVERLIAGDAEAQTLVQALRRSDLPYREAVEDLVAVPDLGRLAADIASPVTRRPPASSRRFVRLSALAAALALVFVGGIVAERVVFKPEPKSTWAVWIDRIANYQALYTRSTLGMPTPPADRQGRQMARIGKALGKAVKAPDLTPLKADFKYARLMAIGEEPLAQIAYLPAQGSPFSLCLMKTARADHGPRYAAAHGQTIVFWRRDGIAFVLVGPQTRAELKPYLDAIIAAPRA